MSRPSQVVPSAGDDKPRGDAGDAEVLCAPCVSFDRAKFLVELLVMTLLLFYVDVVLDVLSIRQMWVTGNPGLCTLNVLGILMASLLGYLLVLRKLDADVEATKKSLRQIWIGGSLYFPQLHVLYFAYQSLVSGRIHPLLFEAKFVEATVESVASASVQVYFLIWAELEWDAKRWIVISVCSSFCTLSFATASFDLRDRGIAGVRGSVGEMASGEFLRVLAFRLCEIIARITSLALFQRACRPFGGVTVVFLDFLVMLLLTLYHGGNLAFAVPSVFAYMNPMLERRNAVSLPCGVYFAVRLAELVVMASAAAWWRGSELPGLYEDDGYVLIGFVLGFLGAMALLPWVRSMAEDCLLSYPPEAWYARPFSEAERKLLRDLLSRSVEWAACGERPMYRPLEGTEESRLLAPLASRLPPAFDFRGAEMPSEVTKVLVLAQNCPVWCADEQLKCALVLFLCKLSDIKEAVQQNQTPMQREVLDGGGVAVALELAEHDSASAELQGHALRLTLLTLTGGRAQGDSLSSLIPRAKQLAHTLLTDEPRVKDSRTIAAMAQAAAVAEAFGGNTEELMLRGPCPAGGVLAAFAAGLLQRSPSQASIRKVLADYGAEPFPWSDQETEAGQVLGGLCISKLLQRTFAEGSREHEWALQLRTPAEVVMDLSRSLDTSADEHEQAVVAMLERLLGLCVDNPKAVAEAGCCMDSLQSCFLRSSSAWVRLWCVHLLKALLGAAHASGGFAGPLAAELSRGLGHAFFQGLAEFLSSLAEDKQVVEVVSGALLAISNAPALHVELFPLVPVVISTAKTNTYNATFLLYNMTLAECSRPRLREDKAVPKLLQDVIAGKIKAFEEPVEDFAKAARYGALHALSSLLEPGATKLISLVAQPANLRVLLDALEDGAMFEDSGTNLAVFEPAIPFPVLATLPAARAELGAQGVVGSLRSFCLKMDPDNLDQERALYFAFQALSIFLTYPESAARVDWGGDAGQAFEAVVKRALERPLLRREAETLIWHCQR